MLLILLFLLAGRRSRIGWRASSTTPQRSGTSRKRCGSCALAPALNQRSHVACCALCCGWLGGAVVPGSAAFGVRQERCANLVRASLGCLLAHSLDRALARPQDCCRQLLFSAKRARDRSQVLPKGALCVSRGLVSSPLSLSACADVCWCRCRPSRLIRRVPTRTRWLRTSTSPMRTTIRQSPASDTQPVRGSVCASCSVDITAYPWSPLGVIAALDERHYNAWYGLGNVLYRCLAAGPCPEPQSCLCCCLLCCVADGIVCACAQAGEVRCGCVLPEARHQDQRSQLRALLLPRHGASQPPRVVLFALTFGMCWIVCARSFRCCMRAASPARPCRCLIALVPCRLLLADRQSDLALQLLLHPADYDCVKQTRWNRPTRSSNSRRPMFSRARAICR